MTTQTDPRAPYLSISVQLDTPDLPRHNGRPVRRVSWSAIRYPGQPVTFICYAHHSESLPEDERLTVLLRTDSLADAQKGLDDWVPWPPAGWLASLELGQVTDQAPATRPTVVASMAAVAAQMRSAVETRRADKPMDGGVF